MAGANATNNDVSTCDDYIYFIEKDCGQPIDQTLFDFLDSDRLE